VAHVLPNGLVVDFDGDAQLAASWCDADGCKRLDASARQLVDLDVAVDRRCFPQAAALRCLEGACPGGRGAKLLRASGDATAAAHAASVRIGEGPDDVCDFFGLARRGAVLASRLGALRGFDFAVEPLGVDRLFLKLARPAPRVALGGGGGGENEHDANWASPLCCGLAPQGPDVEGAASLAARGSWSVAGEAHGAPSANGEVHSEDDDGPAKTSDAALPRSLLDALTHSERAARAHGLSCAGTLNALARAHGDRVLRDRVSLAQAGLDQGRKRVIQRRFNVGVLEAISERKASTLRVRPER